MLGHATRPPCHIVGRLSGSHLTDTPRPSVQFVLSLQFWSRRIQFFLFLCHQLVQLLPLLVGIVQLASLRQRHGWFWVSKKRRASHESAPLFRGGGLWILCWFQEVEHFENNPVCAMLHNQGSLLCNSSAVRRPSPDIQFPSRYSQSPLLAPARCRPYCCRRCCCCGWLVRATISLAKNLSSGLHLE